MQSTLPADGLTMAAGDEDEESVFGKITRRIIPILFLCLVLNFVDRINIGFAQLQMKH